jgi:protein TonB
MSARMRGEEGVVTVLATIDAAGRAQSVALEKSSGFTALDRAALAASRRANFAASGGPAVAGSRILLTFRFKLVDS